MTHACLAVPPYGSNVAMRSVSRRITEFSELEKIESNTLGKRVEVANVDGCMMRRKWFLRNEPGVECRRKGASVGVAFSPSQLLSVSLDSMR